MYHTNRKLKEDSFHAEHVSKAQKAGKKRSSKEDSLPYHKPIQFFSKKDSINKIENIPQKNNTGLPEHLKLGMESLSGFRMDDVRVHYNSSKPAQLQALAYTQGTQIHIAPGQEQHLAHEAWHVVQQKQGRVNADMQIRGMGVNTNVHLEHEADLMGRKASASKYHRQVLQNRNTNNCIQRKIKYLGKLYEDGEADLSELINDRMVKCFFSDTNKIKAAVDSIKMFNIDGMLGGFESAVIQKITKDYPPKNYFIVKSVIQRRNQAIEKYYLCRAGKALLNQRELEEQGQEISEAVEEAIENLHIEDSGTHRELSQKFKKFHIPNIITRLHREYRVLKGLPEARSLTRKTQSRFEYVMENKIIKASAAGTNYIYRSMPLENAKKLESFWQKQSKPLPARIPEPHNFNIHEIGMDGHMGSFDQAFCKYHQGTPVEFEMKQTATPTVLAVRDNITGYETAAANGEGIPASDGKLGIKTESQGGNFSFGLPSKGANGDDAKEVVWNFLQKVKNIKVYYLRPVDLTSSIPQMPVRAIQT